MLGGSTALGAPRRAIAFALASCALVAALATTLCAPAFGLISTEREPDPLTITVESDVQLSRVDIVALPAVSDPVSVMAGIPCGMLEMCGQDPCLCGSVDEWGACACNGKRETKPTWSLVCSEEGIVALVDVFGSPYLVALGAGETSAVLSASLAHHETPQVDMHISVAQWTPLDVVKIIVGVIAIVVVLALVLFVLRALLCGVVRVFHRLRETLRLKKEKKGLSK